MDKNETAKTLAKLGRQEARLMAKLAEVQAERCAFLQSLLPQAELEPDVMALVVAPKDDGED